jgi:hypothetical protein
MALMRPQGKHQAVFGATQCPRRMRRLLSASSEGRSCASTPCDSLAPHHPHRSHTTREERAATQSTAPCLVSCPQRQYTLEVSQIT